MPKVKSERVKLHLSKNAKESKDNEDPKQSNFISKKQVKNETGLLKRDDLMKQRRELFLRKLETARVNTPEKTKKKAARAKKGETAELFKMFSLSDALPQVPPISNDQDTSKVVKERTVKQRKKAREKPHKILQNYLETCNNQKE